MGAIADPSKCAAQTYTRPTLVAKDAKSSPVTVLPARLVSSQLGNDTITLGLSRALSSPGSLLR